MALVNSSIDIAPSQGQVQGRNARSNVESHLEEVSTSISRNAQRSGITTSHHYPHKKTGPTDPRTLSLPPKGRGPTSLEIIFVAGQNF